MRQQFTIGGAGGSGKHQGSSSGTEAPNTLKSRQTAKLVDLLSEGPIRGVVNGLESVLLDGTAMVNADGSGNFTNAVVQFANGYPDQPIMNGFEAQLAETAVSIQLRYNQPQTRSIANTDVDRTRITLSVPSLQVINKSTGDISGTDVSFRVQCQSDGGGFQLIGDYTISGKTSSRYQRSVMFVLPHEGPWDIRVTRLTADSTVQELQNDLYWDSYTEIIDDRVNYSHSACVGIMIDAEQFNSIPKRTYLTDGLLCQIPSNYNGDTGIYTGTWDGTFQFGWHNNPAWVLYDLIINNRYGIGAFISPAMVDKWAFYKVAQWCDMAVPDGKGGVERRHTCNIQITDRQEAFDLLASIASIFRGFIYWSGGQLVPVADQPSDPVMQFTNANVVGGQFSYTGTEIRARHTVAAVSWNDPAFLGEQRLAVVEDQAQISRFGIQKADLVAVGCTVESQALRVGKWAIYTEAYEGEAIQFTAGLESAWSRPGDIIQVMDINVAGERRGGRVAAGSTAHAVNFDADVPTVPVAPGGVYLSCIIGEGNVETRQVLSLTETQAVMLNDFSAAPAPDTVFVVNAGGALEPTLWRVLGARQTETDQYELSGVRHFPGKWGYIENNLVLTTPDTTDIVTRPPAVTGIEIVEYLQQTSAVTVGVRVTLSWISSAPLFDVYYRRASDNWQYIRTDQAAVDLAVTEDIWTFQITPIGTLGFKGPTSTITYTVIGRFVPPDPPKQFRIKISDGVALFQWLPATEIDVIVGGHFELRQSSATSGASWASAQVVVPSIPGSATSVEAVYRTGTWFLRTFDIVGVASKEVAAIIALQPDGRYNEFARICENPDWLGTHNYTEVLEPQQWLVLGQTGGLWDAQLADMDDWPDVDVLVEGMPDPPESEPRYGWYIFDNRIDAGGIFPVRFTADILAFPFADPDEFIDSRLTNCDDWNDWDDANEDLGGQVALYIRTTDQDPASPTAAWSDWQPYAPVEYTARGFEFRADLYAPAGQNIGVEELCITADLKMKMDSAEDVPYPAATTHVSFTVKFYLVPSVVVTVQEAQSSDNVTILNKTREGFDIQIKNNSGVHQTRTFDWQSRGF